MTHTVLPRCLSVTLLAFALSGTAFATGNHAGGHGHGTDETAIGKPGVAAKVNRTIAVDMADTLRYTPSNIQVKRGETIRFVITNSGQTKHELSLGTEKELRAHLEEMKKFPDMEHDEPNKLTLAPGGQGDIIWQFTKAGPVHFGCLMPGHYEGGMKGVVNVGTK
ncbi:MAG: cupredoxin family protein [Burkholderiales bacterium]|nr:cupredoxin family protein [Burkholderiales bacterium]